MIHQQHEPLLDDRRLAGIEGKIRRDFPQLSEKAQFVTFIQPATFTHNREGIDVPIPEVAVFALVQPSPRHPTWIEITPLNVWLTDWRASEVENRHSSDDQAYQFYRRLTPVHIERMKNLAEMN